MTGQQPFDQQLDVDRFARDPLAWQQANEETLRWLADLYVLGEMPGYLAEVFDEQLAIHPTLADYLVREAHLLSAIGSMEPAAMTATMAHRPAKSESAGPRRSSGAWLSVAALLACLLAAIWMNKPSTQNNRATGSNDANPQLFALADAWATQRHEWHDEADELWVDHADDLHGTLAQFADEQSAAMTSDPSTATSDIPAWLLTASNL